MWSEVRKRKVGGVFVLGLEITLLSDAPGRAAVINVNQRNEISVCEIRCVHEESYLYT